MFEIEDIANTEFDGLLEHIDLGGLDVVDSRSRGYYAKYVRGGICGELCSGMDSCYAMVLSYSSWSSLTRAMSWSSPLLLVLT